VRQLLFFLASSTLAAMSQNPYEAPRPVSLTQADVSQLYLQLPWYRKSPYVSIFVFVGLCCSPAILAVCVIVLTGDVYYNQPDPASGGLKKWSYANKVLAFIILAIQILVFAARIFGVNQPVERP
jgi:hypothetical protein